jgi:hypothetical protein
MNLLQAYPLYMRQAIRDYVKNRSATLGATRHEGLARKSLVFTKNFRCKCLATKSLGLSATFRSITTQTPLAAWQGCRVHRFRVPT